MKNIIVGFPHKPQSVGGPGSFQTRMTLNLENKGCRIVYPQDKICPDVIIVVGGTAKLSWLFMCKKRGAKIVHRLDGINWRHWVDDVSLLYKLKSEFRNFLIRIIRDVFSDYVIYQSEFVHGWWGKKYGKEKKQFCIINNGVALDEFYPKEDLHGDGKLTLICAEGNLHADKITCHVLEGLDRILLNESRIGKVKLACKIDKSEINKFNFKSGKIEFLGSVPREKMPEVFRFSDIFLNLDINAACPNAVVEALASGLPIVGFDTGALTELVINDSGVIVSYDGDPWALDLPNIEALSEGLTHIIENFKEYKKSARNTAIKFYNIENIMEKYEKVIESVL
jgi:glycosyltransferase involved in cell wall biosynthesis